MRFVLYALLALVVCLCASTIWAEFVISRSPLETALPRYVQVELSVFRVIVLPPVLISPASLNGAYADMVSPGSSRHRGVIYSPPPTWAAFEFLRVGVPFWAVVFLVVGESARALGRLRRRTAAK
jgi:hypothetical protein